MSAPTLHVNTQARPSAVRGLRLRLKPTHRACGFLQGAWWPHSPELITELPCLLASLTPRVGRIDRVIYDESSWAPTQLRIEFGGHSVILEGSPDQSINTLSVIGEDFRRLVLLVVPPYTNPTRAYTAVTTASSSGDVSSADELLGIGAQAAEDRRLALIAQQRWESEGGAICRLAHSPAGLAAATGEREVRSAQ